MILGHYVCATTGTTSAGIIVDRWERCTLRALDPFCDEWLRELRRTIAVAASHDRALLSLRARRRARVALLDAQCGPGSPGVPLRLMASPSERRRTLLKHHRQRMRAGGARA